MDQDISFSSRPYYSFLRTTRYTRDMGFEMMKDDAARRDEGDDLRARRDALYERVAALKHTLDEGDKTYAGRTMTEAERTTRSKILVEDLADLRRAEEMLKLLDQEIEEIDSSVSGSISHAHWNDAKYRDGDNRGAAAH
jgi:hypothetical protein